MVAAGAAAAGDTSEKLVVGRIRVGASEARAGTIGMADATTIGRARGSGAFVLIGLLAIFAADCADLFFPFFVAAVFAAFGLVVAAIAGASASPASGARIPDGFANVSGSPSA